LVKAAPASAPTLAKKPLAKDSKTPSCHCHEIRNPKSNDPIHVAIWHPVQIQRPWHGQFAMRMGVNRDGVLPISRGECPVFNGFSELEVRQFVVLIVRSDHFVAWLYMSKLR
jgi:hypothetical protein